MSQQKIAIDIVLLLPQQVEELVCDLSRKVVAPENVQPLVLDGTNYIPHISLLMGTIEEADIEKYNEALEMIFKKYVPMNIVINSLDTNLFPNLKIGKTKELLDLQKELMETINLDYDATAQMFLNSEGGKEQIDWVNNFKENSSGDNYNPHVTIGIGDASACEMQLPVSVEIKNMAICHLGYGCSCRRIIKKF